MNGQRFFDVARVHTGEGIGQKGQALQGIGFGNSLAHLIEGVDLTFPGQEGKLGRSVCTAPIDRILAAPLGSFFDRFRYRGSVWMRRFSRNGKPSDNERRHQAGGPEKEEYGVLGFAWWHLN